MSQTFEGKSVDEALESAAAELGVETDELQHEVVEEKTDDFWGLGEKVVVIRAWPEGAEEPTEEEEPEAPPAPPEEEPAAEEPVAEEAAPEEQEATQAAVSEPEEQEAPPERQEAPEEPAPEPAAEPTPAADADVREIEPGVVAAAPEDVPSDEPTLLATQEPLVEEDLAEAAVALLAKIFDAMDFDCEAQAKMEDDTLQVAISGEDNQFLLDGRGRGLSALELVLNHAFRHRSQGGRKRVRVDAGDFRSQRDDEIRDMAYQVAHQAKETGSPQQTRELNPYERRIVHLTLADDSNITTRSEGSGFLKAVNVIPQGGGRGR